MSSKDPAPRIVEPQSAGATHDLLHSFAAAPELERQALVDLLGGKAAGLVEMTRAGRPCRRASR